MNSAITKASAPRQVAVAFAALLGAVTLLGGGARAAAEDGAQTVRSFYDTLLGTMQNGAALGQKGRYEKLAPVVLKTFDIPYMTRMAVGARWADLPASAQQRVTDAFARYVAATYADRFDSYSGEKLQVAGEQPSGSGVIVESRIVKPDGSPVAINYLMHQDGQSWRIADVYLTGTVSELATRRSEFTAILARQGVDGLITTLDRKTETLLASEQ